VIARRWISVLVTAALAAAALPGRARARSLERFQFRVDTATGKTRQLWGASGEDANTQRPKPTGGARLAPAPRLLHSGGVSGNAGAAILYDKAGNVRVRVPMSDGETDWSPWAVLRGDLLVFAWRSKAKGVVPETTRDAWTAVDVRDGRPLWRRDNSYWYDAGEATALNDRALVVDGPSQVEIVESRTGKTLRALAKRDRAFSMTDLPDGLLVEAGDDVHLLDRATGDSRWRIGKHGGLISWTPIPGANRAIMQTAGATAVVDTRAAKILWNEKSSSAAELWIVGDRIYEPTIERRSMEQSIVGLTERRLADGAAVGHYLVQDYRGFCDIGGAGIIGAHDGQVDIETEWIVLD
jgi:hypothetical protein